ncbi:group III truncated hemoglobin [Sulfitobacter sp. S190]|uniref:group III truncated hemoglobin n=1 Tax=Sulfitobacter sp. S190 TaxID=2867022 RepID=UPI0021A53384|nr:group III truncated hemoglobin [Sulfitobacter sp. S190]UWR24591.1 group III truncated hemoglobin [Sulfitobacter sp. S190]
MQNDEVQLARGDIERIVTTFYSRVRTHSELGPVFDVHVADWPAHEEKIARFWANAILKERKYSGNPMKVHASAGNVRPEHFKMWLDLFDEVLDEELSNSMSSAWSRLAHRIGQGLVYGLQLQQTSDQGDPPQL